MFYGPGAGGSPTASAVLGDLVTVARNRLRGAVGPGESSYASRPVSEIGSVTTRYHLSLEVADRAGVLATIARVFAEHDVSIETVRQNGRDADAQLVIVTHRAQDAALSATVRALRKLDIVAGHPGDASQGECVIPESFIADRRSSQGGPDGCRSLPRRRHCPLAIHDHSGEGGTPLLRPRLSENALLDWIKVEGATTVRSRTAA